MVSTEDQHNGTYDQKTILIGVAWPYANGNIHLGHVAGSLLSPDIFSRYHRMIGNRVLMVSGSDEHGTPITVRAERESKTPQEVVDFFHAQTLRDLKSLRIEFDLFSRTTHPNHYRVVQDLFLTLYEQGYIYPKTTTELYCQQCDKFLPDRYVNGICPHCGHEKARGDQCDECGKTYNAVELVDPKCNICGSLPVPKETEHFFFRLPAFSERLLDFLKDKDHWKSRVVNFTRNWIQEGLRDRPITRDISWGVPVPLEGYDSKRIYVWFDAVTGYLSASRQWSDEVVKDPNAWKSFWLNPETRSFYFLGKDNVPFHTIIWPSMLMGLSDGKGEPYNIPYNVPANEYLRLGGKKFTKSGGIGVDVKSFLKEYRTDEVRYYLSIIMPENRDVDFDMDEFRTHINNELVATFGNFIHRVLSFTSNNFGRIPPCGDLAEADMEALEEIKHAGTRISDCIENCQFKNGMKEIMALAAFGNRYLGERAPWHLIKTDRESCATVLNVGMRLVKALSIVSYPYLPVSMEKLRTMLHIDVRAKWSDAFTDFTSKQYQQELERPTPLFRVLEDRNKDDGKGEPRAKDGGKGEPRTKGGGKGEPRTKGGGKGEPRAKGGGKDEPEGKGDGGKDMGRGTGPAGQQDKDTRESKKRKKKSKEIRKIEIGQVDMRTGRILDVQDHPDADKLFIMKVDVGEEEPRTLVAGLRQHYTAAELRRKDLVIVCNLKPAKLRGVVSQGMMLAASDEDAVLFLTPDGPVQPGTSVHGHLSEGSELLEMITIDEFANLPITVRRVSEIMDTQLILDDDSAVSMGDLDGESIFGKLAVHVEGNLLRTKKFIVRPEKEIGPGAKIR